MCCRQVVLTYAGTGCDFMNWFEQRGPSPAWTELEELWIQRRSLLDGTQMPGLAPSGQCRFNLATDPLSKGTCRRQCKPG